MGDGKIFITNIRLRYQKEGEKWDDLQNAKCLLSWSWGLLL